MPENPSSEFLGLFVSSGPPADKEEEPKVSAVSSFWILLNRAQVKTLRQIILKSGGVDIQDSHILWALRSSFANGNVDEAYKLCMLMLDSWEGLLRDYKPATKLLGAVNRNNVTCYLDALLFAMFSRLSSFEAMLYNSFDAPSKQRLAILLRLWVNMLRSGELIPTDITKLLQDTLAECGWMDAAEIHQQDASEAFTFITSQLELPLLTLKMDIYHFGREDTTDDHKFINERLLEVAIPVPAPGEPQTVTLEDCLETYFNNRIEVRRYLERRNTLKTARSRDDSPKAGIAVHVETVELDSVDSPVSNPSTPTVSDPRKQLRHRAASIVQQRFVPDSMDSKEKDASVDGNGPTGRSRAGSIRKEVMMPAWQFFSLIPWYTDNTPANDAQVAAHFSSQRPILGMCLKRYSVNHKGQAMRLGTQVDIPVEIGLPHFIKDDRMDEDASIYGNFKLSLQSVVCHRGNSVDSGHYISLVRGTTGTGLQEGQPESNGRGSVEDPKHWMRFDDLAKQRITLIDIHEALQQETPYLLFYQILPIEGDPGHITDGEGGSFSASDTTGLTGLLNSNARSSISKDGVSDQSAFSFSPRPSMEDTDRSSVTGPRRSSLVFAEPENVPDIPSAVSSRRGSRDERKTSTLTRLTKRLSGEKLQAETTNGAVVPQPPEVTVTVTDSAAAVAPDKARGDNGEGRSVLRKEHKREKSKSRLRGKLQSGGESRGEKPDRECIVM